MNGGIEQILDESDHCANGCGKNRNIYEVDGMALLGFGPRTLSVAKELALRVEATNTPDNLISKIDTPSLNSEEIIADSR